MSQKTILDLNKHFEKEIAKEFKNHKHYATSMLGVGSLGQHVYRNRKGKQLTWSQYNTLVEKDILRRSKRIIDKLTKLGR
jgi:predicted AAA+ superfamily ATPase